MTKIYTAADPLQAHILRGALETAGIAAEVRGDYLFSTRGESPVTPDTAPAVWILRDADLEEARAIASRMDATPEHPAGHAWPCRCGEAVEATFDQCWNCGASRPGASDSSEPDSPER